MAAVIATVLAAAGCGAVPRVYPPPTLLAVAPVTAGDHLRALADRLQPAPADHLSASCAVVLVFERTSTPSGGQRIREHLRVRYQDGSGYQLSEARPTDWGTTRKARLGEAWDPTSPAVAVTSYPAGRLNLIHGPPSVDPRVLAGQLRQLQPHAGRPGGAGPLLRAVADLASWYHLDQPVRTAVVRLLADAGVAVTARGEGIIVSARSGPVVDRLQLDQITGQLVAAYQETDTRNGPVEPIRDRLWHRHAHPDDEGAPFYTTNPAAKARQRLDHACHTTDATSGHTPSTGTVPGTPHHPEPSIRPPLPVLELRDTGTAGPPYPGVPGYGVARPRQAACAIGQGTDPAPAAPATPAHQIPRLRLLDVDHNEPAAPALADLATRVGAALGDRQTGPCTHIAVSEWATAPSGTTAVRLFGHHQHRYRGGDGSGRIITTGLRQPTARTVIDYPPGGLPLPFAGATILLDRPIWHADDPFAAVLHPDPQVGVLLAVAAINGSLVPNRQQRASILHLLATTDGLTYRGHGIDHIGRIGIAVTADHHGGRHLLLLSETTGELLAYTHTRPAGTGRPNLVQYTLHTSRGHRLAPAD